MALELRGLRKRHPNEAMMAKALLWASPSELPLAETSHPQPQVSETELLASPFEPQKSARALWQTSG
jgi:hypothetical protein